MRNAGVGRTLSTAWWEHWPYVKVAVALFVGGGLIGGLLVALEVDLFALIGMEGFLDEALPDEITVVTLFVNNSIVFVLAIIGLLSFGLLTGLILVVNGLIVGYVLVPVASESGIAFVLAGIVPHGILELPALFVAAAVAFRLLHRFVMRLRDRRSTILDAGERRQIAILLAAAWLALAIAAVIEAHVTLWLLETLFPEQAAAGA